MTDMNPVGIRVRTQRARTVFYACLVAVALVGAASSAWANDSTAKEGGLGFAAGITTLIYSPLKIVYAVGGTTASGLTWVFSGGDSKAAKTVLTRSVRGSYTITPDMLRGREDLEFVGRAPEYRSPPPSQVAAAPAPPEAW